MKLIDYFRREKVKKNTNIITKNNKEKKQLNNRKTLKGINLGKIRLGKKQTAVIGIILIVAIYVTYKVINLIKNPSDTFFIEKGKIYEEENAIGYIIRDEKVVKGENYKNGILQIENLIIYSAERVRRHPLICTEKGLPRRQPLSIGKFPT